MKALKSTLFLISFMMLAIASDLYAAQITFTPAEIDSIARDERDRFLKYDYPETKDVCKQFLTLVVGVLVFTLTFSEKIINFSTASKMVKGILIAGWIFFILSIILCGLGLVEMLLAAGKAVYDDNTYDENESSAIYLIGASGLLFILGLISIMVDSILMLYQKPTIK